MKLLHASRMTDEKSYLFINRESEVFSPNGGASLLNCFFNPSFFRYYWRLKLQISQKGFK